MTDLFYQTLEPFDDFSDFSDLGSYTPVPDDWHVVLTDVVNSTIAIEAGRYKDVNMVGAASITAVLNQIGDLAVPFVFGGDGGTLVVPPGVRHKAADAVCALMATSEQTFGLALRGAVVPVSEIRKHGGDILIRKFRLSPGNHLALFAGGGLDMADRLMKDPSPDNPFALKPSPDQEPDLAGLSCRWEPLEPKGGVMLTLMVQPLDRADNGRAALAEILEAIRKHLGGQIASAAPANDRSLRFRWPPRGLMLEARSLAGRASALMRLPGLVFESFAQLLCETFKITLGPYNGASYRGELQTNTDFRKFDDTLRMVLDVTPSQADAIETMLEENYQRGLAIYGLHRAGRALMTCLVFDLRRSQHVHFIDGADGGFAKASIGFKQRRQNSL
ncbi:DUF3095 domain-containing protein [Coralliovum pocilloporae]|uniref:DUF3095 domain-containing protein n=1 Tax=Coralliovum pocilloporae TaxID=3066369 RepID=UPI0033072B52